MGKGEVEKEEMEKGEVEKEEIEKEEMGKEGMEKEDIEKEAAILQHLTRDNASQCKDIASFVEWFETREHFYLVTEYVHGVTLREFVDGAFEQITAKRLSYWEYRQCAQSIVLQLIETIAWLHGVYKCCHLVCR